MLTGSGTLAREWEDQSPGLDTRLIAVGGGGLIGGAYRPADGERVGVLLCGANTDPATALQA